MPQHSKLGRNPLHKLKAEAAGHEEFVLPPQKTETVTALAKIKEMQIKVDWTDLYESTLDLGVRKVTRFFKKF